MTRDELETLVRIHQAELYRYLRYLGAESPAVAEDLVQETLLAAYTSEARGRRPEAGNLRSSASSLQPRVSAAWLRGIARNLFLEHCRRARKDPVKADGASLERAEATWAEEFLRKDDGFDYVEALRHCLSKLDERNRRVLELHYGEGKSRTELAEFCKMTEDGIKSLLRRLRAILGECVKRRLVS